ncbi:MAG: hypothetical protein IKU72_02160 [Oscillospiraceae bacterium]|nr:hypothetical protein [Oscillospiraceae bacterium]
MTQQHQHRFIASAAVLTGAAMLVCSAQVADGVRQGLALCGQTLIPSLFPFMVLSIFISRSGASVFLGRLMRPLCRRWLRLPAAFGPVLLMSFLGGYPVGARMLDGMLQRKEATPEEAARFLGFSVCPAPSFAVVTVGAGLLGSAKAGAVLYGCHLFTALLVGGWQARRTKAPALHNTSFQPLPFAPALVEATAAAVEGMLSICGFVLVFSVVLALLQASVIPALASAIAGFTGSFLSARAIAAALCGLLEVTCGIFSCKELEWGTLCLLVPFLVSFGSFSVLCQLSACLHGKGIPMGRLLRGRLIHAALCTLMAAPLLYQMQPALNAMAQAARPLVRSDSILSTLGLLGMCSLFLLSLGNATPKEAKKQ